MEGALLGLDYAGVRAALELMGLSPSRDLFDRLRLVEAGALKEMDDKRS